MDAGEVGEVRAVTVGRSAGVTMEAAVESTGVVGGPTPGQQEKG